MIFIYILLYVIGFIITNVVIRIVDLYDEDFIFVCSVFWPISALFLVPIYLYSLCIPTFEKIARRLK